MQRAIKFEVNVPSDHVITLPADVPVGRAEVIVLLDQSGVLEDRMARARELVEACPAQSSDSADLVAQDRQR